MPVATRGMCDNKRCSMFERSVAAYEGDTCRGCGWHLLHESGLTWRDARAAGYESAFKVTVLPEVEPPADRPATTRYHYAEVNKAGETGGSHMPPDPGARSRAAKKGRSGRRRKR